MILRFLKHPQLATETAQLNPIALVAVSVIEQAIVNFQEISSCHRQFAVLMDDLVSILPIMLSELESVQVAERRALVRSLSRRRRGSSISMRHGPLGINCLFFTLSDASYPVTYHSIHWRIGTIPRGAKSTH
ncbi:hypothetical protein EDB84DRAFT_63327 [Lactarius hengduanensis]|nr:hypothetical protein EDB84DRAFT_63327 [Lactarius hengduanensis]